MVNFVARKARNDVEIGEHGRDRYTRRMETLWGVLSWQKQGSSTFKFFNIVLIASGTMWLHGHRVVGRQRELDLCHCHRGSADSLGYQAELPTQRLPCYPYRGLPLIRMALPLCKEIDLRLHQVFTQAIEPWTTVAQATLTLSGTVGTRANNLFRVFVLTIFLRCLTAFFCGKDDEGLPVCPCSSWGTGLVHLASVSNLRLVRDDKVGFQCLALFFGSNLIIKGFSWNLSALQISDLAIQFHHVIAFDEVQLVHTGIVTRKSRGDV